MGAGSGSQTTTQVNQPAPWIAQYAPKITDSGWAMLNGRDPFAAPIRTNAARTAPAGTGGVMNGWSGGSGNGFNGVAYTGRDGGALAASGSGQSTTGSLATMPKLGAELFSPYPDSTVVPFSRETINAQNATIAAARRPNILGNAAYADLTRMLRQGGVSPVSQGGIRTLQDLSAAGAQPDAVAQYLTPYARGDYLKTANPYLEKAIQDQADATRNDVNLGFSMGGRYGSGANVGVLADKIGTLRNNAMMQNYENEAGRQMQAAQLLGAEQQQGIANRMNAGQGLIGAGQQANAQLLQAGALAPTIDQMRYAGADRLAQVGAQKEDLAQRQLQDKIERWTALRDQPMNKLNWYSNLLMGTGAGSGTTTTTAQAAKKSALSGALGGALSGGSLGSSFGPLGTIIGGGLGALGGFFG